MSFGQQSLKMSDSGCEAADMVRLVEKANAAQLDANEHRRQLVSYGKLRPKLPLWLSRIAAEATGIIDVTILRSQYAVLEQSKDFRSFSRSMILPVHNLRARLHAWETTRSGRNDKQLVEGLSAAINQIMEHIGSNEEARELVQFGVVPILARVLCAALSDPVTRKVSMDVQRCVLMILRELAAVSASSASELVNSRAFVLMIFECMAENILFIEASSLIEELVAVSGVFIDLTTIPNIESLLLQLLPNNAACMCRLLGLLLYDPESRLEMRATALTADSLVHQRLRIAQSDSVQTICDRNVALLMRVPEFLHRLCTLIIHKMPIVAPIMPLGNLQFIRLLGVAQLAHLFSPPVEPAWRREPDNIDTELIGSTAHFDSDDLQLLTQRVEVLFVICTLLQSKRKLDAQSHFIDGNLINSLVHMMRRISWNHPPPAVSPMHQLHGPNCECNPESSLRIQFLQLIMNLCEVDSHSASLKALLLTREEYAAVQRGMDAGVYNGRELAKVPATSRGLMHLILIEFVNPELEKNYRYWMSSVIESFLRGSVPVHQAMVVQAGLLLHISKNILDETSQGVHGLQSSFDLLGEIIKFNPALVLQLECSLGRDGVDNLTRICSSHLVESNMFLRSLLLTMRCAHAAVVETHHHGPFSQQNLDMRFCSAAAASAISGSLEKGMLCTWLCRKEISIMFDLMTSVKEQDINTENICVFNTTLCILMFKRLDNVLCQTLQEICHHETVNGVAGCATGNYRSLLQFWRRYYVLKGRDSSMLHFRYNMIEPNFCVFTFNLICSSNIPFVEWTRTVSLLLEDEAHPLALKSETFYTTTSASSPLVKNTALIVGSVCCSPLPAPQLSARQ
jgi:Trpc4-associated protein